MAETGEYKRISALVDRWLTFHKGETFELDMIARHLDIKEAVSRDYLTQKLSYEVRHGILEKNNRLYRSVDNTIKYIDWVGASEGQTIDLGWPLDRENNTSFDFEDHIVISPGDIIVIAGVSNMGKTAMILNLLWENMDRYPCTLMGNEYVPSKFKRRVSRMNWANPLKEDGTAKFELIERRDGWKDIIRPNNINLIDWINLGDNFYQIGMIIEGIQSVLGGGIAVISLQKSEGKKLGLGDQFGEHLSSVYLVIDFERLTVRKAKEWRGKNPNGNTYGFQIVDGGTQFHNIRRLKKCPRCYGTGHSKGGECDDCYSKGWVDA